MASIAVFWIWAALYFLVIVSQDPVSYSRYAFYSLLPAVGICLHYFSSRSNTNDLLQLDFFGAIRLALWQIVIILGVIVLYLFALKDSAMSRIFLFSYIPPLATALIILNAKSPRFLAANVFHNRRHQTILVGLPGSVERIKSWIEHKVAYGLDVIGIVTDQPEGTDQLPWPVLGRTSELPEILEGTRASQVICLNLPNSLPKAARMGQLCDQHGARLLFVNDLETRFRRSVRFFNDGGVGLLSLREEPLECPLNRIIKRALDLAIALPVVLFLLPLVSLVVFLVQRWQSPGPLFFRQRRTGLKFAPFEIIKFRTMHVVNDDEAVQASEGDPRVYPLGRWFRKFSIDELPQFINVLKAEMSIVGPRPHMVEHDDQFAKAASTYRVRSLVRPGITGLAQVQGFRGETRHADDVVGRVQSDVFYLENWSFKMDWLIILRTAWQVVRPPKSAY